MPGGDVDASSAELAGAQATSPAVVPAIIEAVRDELGAFRQAAAGIVAALPERAPAAPAESRLTLTALALCTEVAGYGVYEPITPRFAAGRRRKVILYVEVDAFRTQQAVDGRWETRLVLGADLIDPRGTSALSVPESPVVDLSRQRRRDFFICAEVTIPGSLRPGRHTLVVTVKDELTGQTADRRMELELVEP